MIAIDDIRKKYGAEMAAIILCCRVFFETASLEELKAFLGTNDIDWYLLIRLTKQNRIRPTVYKILFQVDMPADIKVLLYKQQTEITAQNWKHAVETERLIILLRMHGVEAVPYKGTAFSKQFYGDLISRESSDIDLIIKPGDIAQAIAILKQDAYLPELDAVYNYLGAKYHTYYKDYNFNKFKKGNRVFHVELHWAITEMYLGVNSKANAFMYQARNWVNLVKAEVLMLNTVSHFSSIIIHHGVKDTFRNLKNIFDIAYGFIHADIKGDGIELSKTFADMGLKKTLLISNALAGQLFGVSLLQNEYVRQRTVSRFCKQLLAAQPLKNEDVTNIGTWLKNRILLQDSLIYQLRFCWTTLKFRFTPGEADFSLILLPKPVFFLYYIMKPFRSAIKPIDVVEKRRKLIPAG